MRQSGRRFGELGRLGFNQIYSKQFQTIQQMFFPNLACDVPIICASFEIATHGAADGAASTASLLFPRLKRWWLWAKGHLIEDVKAIGNYK